MLGTEKLYVNERSHFKWFQIFITVALLVWGVRTLMGIISLVHLSVQPESAIHLADTGHSYRFDLLTGYADCSYENLPADAEMVNGKVFCVTFSLLGTVAIHLPVLLLLIYIRKMLKVIRGSYTPLVIAVAEYTNKAGKVLVLMGFFSFTIMQMGMGLIVYQEPYLMNPIQFTWVFAGMILLLFGDIFLKGCALQQISDETL